ncbi:glycosylase, partial [Pectobacterium brasiliense]|nr:glycosylase [Pectobacterium brasiliense]
KVFTPQDVNDRLWLKVFAQSAATLVFDIFVRVYFSCRPPADEPGMYVSYSALVDLDLNNLFIVLRVSENHILPLVQSGEFDEFGTYPVS